MSINRSAIAKTIREHKEQSSFAPGKEGIFFDLPESVYRAATGVNVSSLKPLAESAKKYRWAQDHPMKATPAMIFGSVVHAICLEEHRVASMVVTRPEQWKDWRTDAAKAWRDEQSALVVTTDELAEMHAAAKAVKEHPKAAWILDNAKKEVSVFKRHARTGLLLKARLDLPFEDLAGNTAVADIKKVQSIQRQLFAKDLTSRLLHMQGAFYADIIGASSFYFIAVEEAEPNDVAIYKLGARSMQEGRDLYEALLDRLHHCRSSNHWPGATEESDEIEEIEALPWGTKAADLVK